MHTAERQLKIRIKYLPLQLRWAKIMNDAIYEDSTAPVAIIRYTQWLGEMLALTEPDKTDKEDV